MDKLPKLPCLKCGGRHKVEERCGRAGIDFDLTFRAKAARLESENAALRTQLAAKDKLLRAAIVIAQEVMDDREMPFRCNCDYISPTIDTGHGVLCKVTLARAFLSHPEIKALMKEGSDADK